MDQQENRDVSRGQMGRLTQFLTCHGARLLLCVCHTDRCTVITPSVRAPRHAGHAALCSYAFVLLVTTRGSSPVLSSVSSLHMSSEWLAGVPQRKAICLILHDGAA